MSRERITRRQKDIFRLLQERKQIHKDKLKTLPQRRLPAGRQAKKS